MVPEYFKRVLRPYEAEHYLDGVDKRRHDGWEQMREILVAMSGKEVRSKVIFPWERSRDETDNQEATDKKVVTKEELDDLYEWSNNVLNAIKDGGCSSKTED